MKTGTGYNLIDPDSFVNCFADRLPLTGNHQI